MSSDNSRSVLDGCFHTLIRPAAADITGHRKINIHVRRLRICHQQCRRLHDLARLAVATLRDVALNPRDLERVIAAESFDRGDLQALSVCNGQRA